MGKATVIFMAVWTAYLIGFGWYVMSSEEYPAVEIQASTDVPENGKSVYAQFVYTQTVTLPEPVHVSRIEIPMYINDKAPRVRVYEGDRLLRDWGPDTKEYLFGVPELLSGTLEVQIDGGHILYEERMEAPRVFVELAGYAYPEGSYRIAENEKDGDIGMTLYGERTVLSRLQLKWRNQPSDMLVRSFKYILIIFVVSVWPFVFAGRRAVRSQE